MRSRRTWIGSLAVLGVLGLCGASLVLSEEESVPLNKLPKAVVDAVKARFMGVKLVEATKEEVDGRTIFEVQGEQKGHDLTVTLASGGEIIEIERTVSEKDLPKGVAEALAKKYPGAKIKLAEEVTTVVYEIQLENADKTTIDVTIDPAGAIE